jgi:hypothetical protein
MTERCDQTEKTVSIWDFRAYTTAAMTATLQTIFVDDGPLSQIGKNGLHETRSAKLHDNQIALCTPAHRRITVNLLLFISSERVDPVRFIGRAWIADIREKLRLLSNPDRLLVSDAILTRSNSSINAVFWRHHICEPFIGPTQKESICHYFQIPTIVLRP